MNAELHAGGTNFELVICLVSAAIDDQTQLLLQRMHLQDRLFQWCTLLLCHFGTREIAILAVFIPLSLRGTRAHWISHFGMIGPTRSMYL